VEREIRALQSLAARTDRWTPPIVKTVASEGLGIEDLVASIRQWETYQQAGNRDRVRHTENWEGRLIAMLRDALLEEALDRMPAGAIARYAAEIAAHQRDPYTLVEEIVGRLETKS
jgi:LAO/AO transport system kinase